MVQACTLKPLWYKSYAYYKIRTIFVTHFGAAATGVQVFGDRRKRIPRYPQPSDRGTIVVIIFIAVRLEDFKCQERITEPRLCFVLQTNYFIITKHVSSSHRGPNVQLWLRRVGEKNTTGSPKCRNDIETVFIFFIFYFQLRKRADSTVRIQ